MGNSTSGGRLHILVRDQNRAAHFVSHIPGMQNNLDRLSCASQLNALIDLIQRKNMRNELFCRKFRGNSKLERPLGLTVRCAEMPLDPDIIVVDQIAVQLCHGALRDTAEEHNQASFAHHVDALSLGSIYRGCRNDLVSPLTVGQCLHRFDGVLFPAVYGEINAELFGRFQPGRIDIDHDYLLRTPVFRKLGHEASDGSCTNDDQYVGITHIDKAPQEERKDGYTQTEKEVMAPLPVKKETAAPVEALAPAQPMAQPQQTVQEQPQQVAPVAGDTGYSLIRQPEENSVYVKLIASDGSMVGIASAVQRKVQAGEKPVTDFTLLPASAADSVQASRFVKSINVRDVYTNLLVVLARIESKETEKINFFFDSIKTMSYYVSLFKKLAELKML